MRENDVKKTNSGIKKEGKLEDIAKFARDVEEVMEEEDVKSESLEEFNNWRPREEDNEEDLQKKTVEAASISKKKMEEESNGVEDITEAGEKAIQAGKKMGEGENPEPEVKDASKKILKPFYAASAKVARGFEKKVYSKLMLKFNPYFFDSEDISADLRREDSGYRMDIDASDKKYREALKNQLAGKE